MNIAKIIVERFGGQTALATLLGKGQSTVSYWVKTGVIPTKWHSTLLAIAKENGIRLSADDFFNISTNSDAKQQDNTPMNTPKIIEPEPELEPEPTQTNFLFYSSTDGTTKVQVAVGNETIWASQKGMAEIFCTTRENITIHLGNIFQSEELVENSVCKEILLPGPDNKMYNYKMYNLDAIISVGYRISSYQATQFRQWATTILKEYLIKGFALNDDRLKQGNQLFGKDYFDELLERIREIRASERRFYQKITDIYAQCSMDYDKNSPITQQFYARVQDKLHYAIHGHTSAELIELRADATKPNMGLYSYKNSGKHGKVTKLDVTVGKNYMTKTELDEMNRLVSMYLDMAESFARRHKQMTMKDWAERLDGFLEFNGYDILQNFGSVKRETAERHALAEYDKFRVTQDRDYVSDFDEIVDEIKSNMRLPKK